MKIVSALLLFLIIIDCLSILAQLKENLTKTYKSYLQFLNCANFNDKFEFPAFIIKGRVFICYMLCVKGYWDSVGQKLN